MVEELKLKTKVQANTGWNLGEKGRRKQVESMGFLGKGKRK